MYRQDAGPSQQPTHNKYFLVFIDRCVRTGSMDDFNSMHVTHYCYLTKHRRSSETKAFFAWHDALSRRGWNGLKTFYGFDWFHSVFGVEVNDGNSFSGFLLLRRVFWDLLKSTLFWSEGESISGIFKMWTKREQSEWTCAWESGPGEEGVPNDIWIFQCEFRGDPYPNPVYIKIAFLHENDITCWY